MKIVSQLCNFFLILLLISCGSDDSPVATEDTEAPSTPLQLTASSITETSAQLSWEAATDNVGVASYQLYENGTLTETAINATSFAVTSLSEETTYNFKVTAIDAAGNESGASNTVTFSTIAAPLRFETNLSDMGIYTGTFSDLTPADGVQLYELNSTLFTDYAKKQRLVRLPNDTKLEYNNSDLLPKFPDNTLIAKTFYYYVNEGDPSQGKQIIETRVLLKIEGSWQVGNYVWNGSMTDAVYSEAGSVDPISYIDTNGETQNINYVIPSKTDCFTCHNNDENTFPIGMKLRSMNFTPSYVSQNQLDYFSGIGLLDGVNSASISILPDWTDESLDIFSRARAYIDINCAHCHQPGGPVSNFGLDFRLETPYEGTGIYANRGEIEARTQSNIPSYMMPQLGRTIVHNEAVVMLLQYLDEIEP
ncbi:fibronectin type III domain-containing protein [Ulvibacter litoralis]|uniref:Fibronectin type-III domain-containing protein n=1 Tax=Ulvibacter litoralis TaxID=227084 RepID=A0A1G7C656_9FLAO|nr:fibronectin type III domain-containing protein [Ulvibacter litoralis]GHC48692.1 hypothetical protein GCM10008083_10080 [Ulvibacter litoralis]SDE34270.1 conserved hypothetical protein, HNE_0200 family [Ulvibacter litoralis]